VLAEAAGAMPMLMPSTSARLAKMLITMLRMIYPFPRAE
jgi:hypothetical protein